MTLIFFLLVFILRQSTGGVLTAVGQISAKDAVVAERITAQRTLLRGFLVWVATREVRCRVYIGPTWLHKKRLHT